MVAVPTAPALTGPGGATVAATVVLLLLHVPKGVASLNCEDKPVHELMVPVIAAGCVFTVRLVIDTHPVTGTVYVIAVVPANTPFTVPEVTVAILVLPLVHVPPDVVLLNAVVKPSHTTGVPVIAGGAGFTVTVVVTEHPVPAV